MHKKHCVDWWTGIVEGLIVHNFA